MDNWWRSAFSKVEVDEEGHETEHAMNDHIEIGIYANSPEGELGELLYLKQHMIISGEQTVEIIVPKQPDLAGIGPRRLLIDRISGDNFVEIKVKGKSRRE